MGVNDYWTVVNRSKTRVAKTTWNGQHYELQPLEEKMFPEDIAFAFKRWNIQTGSLDPRTGRIVLLVGIKEKGDPCTPIEQDVLIDPATGKPHVETWDRSKLTGSRPSQVVDGDNGLYSIGDWKHGQNPELGTDGR